MPKRKRNLYEDGGDRGPSKQKQNVQEKLAQSKNLLHRALKTAKGFERQKLGKRLKVATTNGHSEDITRMNREIEALKSLDLDKATNAHLHKTLLKIKAFAESELLPNEVKETLPKPEGSEEMVVAIHNVTSGMYNTKTVKDAMAHILNTMYTTMGIPVPAQQKREKKGKMVEATEPEEVTNLSSNKRITMGQATKIGFKGSDEQTNGSSWDGLSSDDREENSSDHESQVSQDSLDKDTFARYDALLVASSDEESFDEVSYKSKRPQESSKRLSLSLSPTPSASLSVSLASSVSLSESPEPQPRPARALKKSKEAPIKVGGSTFLPTLMGGYWSGSEESASDLGGDAPKSRKNRPGQAARRAIWEKKYGEKANHIKSGQGLAGNRQEKDDGWDLKRGAKDASRGRGRGRGRGRDRGFGARGGSGRSSGRNFEKVTGENTVAIQPGARGLGKRDDVGVLHPSWQAAKKAKELKKTAKFEGKKVTFD